MSFDLRGRISIDGNDAIRTVSRLERESKTLGRAMGNTGESVDKADRAIDRMAGSAAGASSSFSRLDRAVAMSQRTLRRFGSVGGTIFRGLSTGARGLYGQLTSIQSLLAGVGAGYMGVYRPLQLASEAEQAQIAFETMLGSAEKASQFIAELESFAEATPFDVPQMRDNARMLMAFGFEAERVLPIMEALGNASAGLGAGSEGIERMARALGQIRAKNRLQAEEALQLTEVGINVNKYLAEAAGVSTAVIQDEMSKGLIPAEAAINIIIDGMNKQFPDMMDKQAASMAGLWAQITETFDTDILRKWGQGIAEELRPRLDALNRWITDNEDTIGRWGSTLQQTAAGATSWLVTKLESGFEYVRANFLDNPEFTELSFTGKVGYAFDRLKDAYDKWYEDGGRDQIASVSATITNALGNGLSEAAPAIGKAALEIGKSIGSGVFKGIEQWADDHPMQAALLGGAVGFMVGGAPGAAIGAATLAGGPQLKNIIEDKSAQREMNTFFDAMERIEAHDGNGPLYGGDSAMLMAPPDGSYKRGLDYVPRDGFIAELHRGEMVLTASEAREYRDLEYRAESTTYVHDREYFSEVRDGGGSDGGIVLNFGDININSAGAGSERYDAMKFLRAINRQMAPLLPN